MIKGIDKLNEEQKEIMIKTNKLHKDSVGSEYKKELEIKKVWIDKYGCVCVLLMNKDWYHYLSSGTWY